MHTGRKRIAKTMKRWLVNGILLISTLLLGVQMKAAAETTAEFNMRYWHSSSPLFFEWVENGVGGKQFIVLQFTASADRDAPQRATCTP
jgi:hypothetical protein